MKTDKLEHKIIFFPADDRTDPDPSKNYGVNCVDMRFLVIGKDGITEFQLSTNWYLSHVMERRLQHMKSDVFMGKEDFLLKTWISPYPLDVCYWSKIRLSEDNSYFENGISYIFDKQPVYYGYKYEDESDGVWTTDFIFQQFVEKGVDAVWEFLEKYYHEVFR